MIQDPKPYCWKETKKIGSMELSPHFEALMNKSPISGADVTSFLREMRKTPSGTLVTSKQFKDKIQSASEAQAIQAFDVLEACLSSETEGSIEFRTEIGRYRFLNEVIRILSPKYMGDKTLPAVKERAIKFLEDAAGTKRKQWFPSEHSKILAVYQSLVDGGVIKKNPKFPSTEADEEAELQKSIFDRAENAVVLKKLLQSKDPSDLEAANRLIKNLVEEESKRIERRGELHSLIDRIETSTSLLMEMLSQRRIDKEIVDELATNCRTLREKLGGIATETNDETTTLLQASENLEKVLDLYERKKDCPEDPDTPEDHDQVEDSSSEIGAQAKPILPTMSLVDELLLQLDLGEESDNQRRTMAATTTTKSIQGDNLLNFDIDLSTQSINSPHNEVSAPISNPLGEIERLSRELMEKSLQGQSSSSSLISTSTSSEFKKSVNDKAQTLSQMQKASNAETNSNSNPPKHDPLSLLDFGLLDKSYAAEISSALASVGLPENNLLLDLSVGSISGKSGKTLAASSNFNSSHPSISNNTTISSPVPGPDIVAAKQLLNSVKDLDLDKVELIDDIEPLDLDLHQDSSDSRPNVKLTLTFATVSEYPPSIKVGIITFTNRNPTSGISNYVFQLMPPKGLQVKLLPPTAMELPAWKKSFLPPSVLTQVALILIPRGYQNQNSTSPRIKFILSYCTDNDDTALHNGDLELPSSLMA